MHALVLFISAIGISSALADSGAIPGVCDALTQSPLIAATTQFGVIALLGLFVQAAAKETRDSILQLAALVALSATAVLMVEDLSASLLASQQASLSVQFVNYFGVMAAGGFALAQLVGPEMVAEAPHSHFAATPASERSA